MKKTWIQLLACMTAMVMLLTGFALAEDAPSATGEYDEAFAEWNPDAPALNALIEYVEAVTDPDSPDFIPEMDRIAVFDMDGTLMGELYPTYLEYYMLAEGGSHQGFEPSAEFLAKRAADSALLDEYCSAVNAETVMIPNLADCMPNSVAANTFGTLLPKLIDGSYTAEQFCEQLTKAAAEALDL